MIDFLGDITPFIFLAAVTIGLWALQNRTEHLIHCWKGCIGHWKHGDRDTMVYFGEKKNEST